MSGIRHTELVNWTVQALLCPRNRVPELAARWNDVVCRPGVYLLLGVEQQPTREVYIGEAEDVLVRLKQHVVERDSWHEALIFTSKDANLTKSHVKYLESRLIAGAKQAARYDVLNDKQPVPPELPRADKDAMEEFLLQMPLLLGVLGHRVLDPLTTSGPRSNGQLDFTYAIKEATARGTVTDDGFVVFKGSTALKGAIDTLTPGYIALKKELLRSGKLLEKGALLAFRDDVLFTSPSAAAAVVYGNNVNGRVAWKAADGRTLKEIEEAATA